MQEKLHKPAQQSAEDGEGFGFHYGESQDHYGIVILSAPPPKSLFLGPTNDVKEPAMRSTTHDLLNQWLCYTKIPRGNMSYLSLAVLVLAHLTQLPAQQLSQLPQTGTQGGNPWWGDGSQEFRYCYRSEWMRPVCPATKCQKRQQKKRKHTGRVSTPALNRAPGTDRMGTMLPHWPYLMR